MVSFVFAVNLMLILASIWEYRRDPTPRVMSKKLIRFYQVSAIVKLVLHFLGYTGWFLVNCWDNPISSMGCRTGWSRVTHFNYDMLFFYTCVNTLLVLSLVLCMPWICKVIDRERQQLAAQE
jgi:hypothetical protein